MEGKKVVWKHARGSWESRCQLHGASSHFPSQRTLGIRIAPMHVPQYGTQFVYHPQSVFQFRMNQPRMQL